MVRTARSQWPYRKRTFRFWRKRARCYRCGLLGFYAQFEQRDQPIGGLDELSVGLRDRTHVAVVDARAKGEIRHEYDARYGNDLGTADWIKGGVRCGVGDGRGPATTWALRRDADPREFLSQGWGGALITGEPGPKFKGPLGNPIAYVQTFTWQLVRPHDCPYFVEHQPGNRPVEHVGLKTGERRERVRTFWIVAGAIAAILALAVPFIVLAISMDLALP